MDKNSENKLPMERLLYEVKKVIVGQDHLLERLIVALLAAQLSVDRGVRVYTIGFGTDNNNSIPNCGFQSPDQFGGQFFGGGGGGGGGPSREIDEETLKQVADMSGGSYHLAVSANELQDVFQNLPTQLMTVTETTEVSVMFVVIGALLVTLAMALSMIWHPLP